MSVKKILDFEVVRFLVAGSLNTGLMYLLYLLLIWAGHSYPLALTMDYVVGIPFSYLLQRYWTFMPKGKLQMSFLKYVLTYIGVFVGNMVLSVILIESGMLGPVIGQFVSLALVIVMSYLVQKFWVFRSAVDGNVDSHTIDR
ncbi:MAG: GtrA family protein [Pseudomonadales bacterium]|nr:GtrA family protein [Pseudomonadales bacterium]